MSGLGKNTFIKQAAILAGAGLAVRFIGFLYRLPLTHMIGDKGNGIYSAGYYIYTFLLILSSAGLPAAISKMVSERLAKKQYYDAHKIFKVSFAFAATFGGIASFVLFFGADFLEKLTKTPGSAYCIRTLAPTVLIVSIASVFRGYFQGMKNNVPTAISQFIEQIFNGVFSVLLAFILVKKSVALGAAGGTAGTGVGALAGLVTIVFVYFSLRPRILKMVEDDGFQTESNLYLLKELIMVAFPIIAGTAIFSLTNIIDMTMVMSRLEASNISPDMATKLYGQLTGKYVVLTTLPVAIATAMATTIIPNIASSVVRKDFEEVNKKTNLSIRLTMIISIPAAFGIGVLGNQILLFLYPKYPAGGVLLEVGAISIVFFALSQITTGILQGLGRLKIPIIGALLGAIIKIPLNYFLIAIPSINVTGAVISTIGCVMVSSGVNFYALQRITKTKFDFMGIFIKPIFASVIMAMASYISYYLTFYVLELNWFSLIFSILIGSLTYLIVMLLIRGIGKEDLRFFPFGIGSKVSYLIELFNL